MIAKEYKKIHLPARKSLLIFGVLLCFLSQMLWAGKTEDGIAEAALARVEAVSRRTRTLDALGKETLREGAILLDLGEAGLPALHKALENKKKGWRIRFWVVDMLGYVGDSGSADLLRKAIRMEKNKKIRKKIGDVLVQIEKRK